MRTTILILGLLLLLAVEIGRVYFIMPFPGSQASNSIPIAYWLDRNIGWLRLVLLALIAYPVVVALRNQRWWRRTLLLLALGLYAVVFYLFNHRFLAEKMFYQPQVKAFAGTTNNTIKGERLVLGVEIGGEAKAYPIQLIGYHHQVRDSVGGQPVMVTYCTVCRSGRVFSPIVDGQPETFRLVGMDHFNAMFEDASTKSWWRQATGEAITGKRKGAVLKEIPSQQMMLSAWLRLHPASTVMQPDTAFNKEYEGMASYDKGTGKSNLTRRDSSSWKPKSWVVGVANGKEAKAWDWNDLVAMRFIQDSLSALPILITLENDTASFHVWNRSINGQVFRFEKADAKGLFHDLNTGSAWDGDGLCVFGVMAGTRLQPVQAYQEFWHSWQTFHPETKK